MLLFWPAPDALCSQPRAAGAGGGGGEDGVWAAVLAGVVLHAADLVPPPAAAARARIHAHAHTERDCTNALK